MRAVEAAGLAVHRLEQVHPPDRLADRDRDGRVNRALELSSVNDPQFQPDAVLGPFLARVRVGIEKVQVADDNADFLENEGLEHETVPSKNFSFRLAARPRSPATSEGRVLSRWPGMRTR